MVLYARHHVLDQRAVRLIAPKMRAERRCRPFCVVMDRQAAVWMLLHLQNLRGDERFLNLCLLADYSLRD